MGMCTKKILIAGCLTLASVQAHAFNPFEKYLEYLFKDKSEKAVTGAVVDTVENGGKDKKAAAVQVPVPIKARLALPLTGKYRFAAFEGGDTKSLPVGTRGGYIDRFGNEWVPVTNKAKTIVLRWEEYLSEDGAFRLGKLAKGEYTIVIDRDGKVVEPQGKKKP